jgi:hypothetical protein
MRATDLIGCAVLDTDGQLIGHVHDLRFETTGSNETGWRCRLTGFACGKRAPLGHRLGYGTGDMAGPWPLSVVFGRIRQRSIEIDWADVTRFDRPRLHVSGRRANYTRSSS